MFSQTESREKPNEPLGDEGHEGPAKMPAFPALTPLVVARRAQRVGFGGCKPIAAVLLLGLAGLLSARAAAPLLEQFDLFEKGQAGFTLYRIPGLVVTTKGTVLAYCEARKNSPADWGEIEVHLRRSTDGGRTWAAPVQVAHRGPRLEGNPAKRTGGEHEQTVNNPVAVVDRQSGAVHFLYCLNYARCFYQRSDDDGRTFSQAVDVTAAFEPFRAQCDWTVIATGPGHGIQLQNGRLLVPVWLASGRRPAHAPAVAATLYSDDHGATWKAGAIALPGTDDVLSPNETACAQLADGRVMLNTRSSAKSNRRVVTTSRDGATGWSQPRFDPALWEPICMGSLFSLPAVSAQDKHRLLFSNPHSLKRDADGREVPGGHGERKNLSIQLSYDDGQTWPVCKTLEPGLSAYSDLGALPDGTLLCFYERQGRLALARFNLEWLTDGKDSPKLGSGRP